MGSSLTVRVSAIILCGGPAIWAECQHLALPSGPQDNIASVQWYEIRDCTYFTSARPFGSQLYAASVRAAAWFNRQAIGAEVTAGFNHSKP